jgi:hypothetical protein
VRCSERAESRGALRGAPPAAFHVAGCRYRSVQRFTVTIEGPNWEDVEEVELPQLPSEGETIETKYGTCLVTHADAFTDTGQHAGRIVCRTP